MNNKISNKIFIYTLAVVFIAILIAGTTYAYWNWSTVRSNEANISLNVAGSSANLYATLNGGGEAILLGGTTLLPTSDCTGSYALNKPISITYKNGTNRVALIDAKLDITRIVYSCDYLPKSSELEHMHWAITTNSSSCSDNVVTAGTFKDLEIPLTCTNNTQNVQFITDPLYGSLWPLYNFTYINEDQETVLVSNIPMISIATATGMTTHNTLTYYLYIWIDEDYDWINYGDDNTDPLSYLEFTLAWHAKIDQNLLCGDVTGNGVVDHDDYKLLQQYAAGILDPNLVARANLLGDVNGSGSIQTADATILNRYISGYSSDPLNCPID